MIMLTGVLGAISGVWLAGLIMLGLGLVFAIVLGQ